MRKIQSLIIVALVFALAVPAFAHKGRDKDRDDKPAKFRGKEKRLEISPELSASLSVLRDANVQWAKDNVVPTLQVWKNKFDSSIEAQDLATLNELRSRASALRTQQKELKKKVKDARWLGDKDAAHKHQDDLRDLRDDFRALADELDPMIEKYSNLLVAMRDEAAPQVQAWRSAHKQRQAEWCKSAYAIAQTENDRRFISRMEEHKGYGKHSPFAEKNGRRLVVRFLLWDGVSLPEEEHDDLPVVGQTPKASASSIAVPKAFPNPADAQTNISFAVDNTSTVKITLYDAAGNVVSIPVNRSYDKGEHTVEIPTQSLPSGNYRYSVEIQGATRTGTLQIVH